MKKKVAVIGLDGATWGLLDTLISNGRMPFLKSLITETSLKETLMSSLPPLTGPAWVTFQTGTDPGGHGVFDFFNYSSHHVPEDIIDRRSILSPTIYSVLDDARIQSAFVNLPVSYPLPEALKHTTIISSLLTPPGKRYCNQDDIYEWLDKHKYIVDLDVSRTEDVSYGKGDFDELTDMIDSRLMASNHILQNRELDFFFVLFKSTDIGQHFFWGEEFLDDLWHYLDSKLRELVGTIRETMGEDTLIIFCSDHGFGPAASYVVELYPLVKSLLGRNIARDVGYSFASLTERIVGKFLGSEKYPKDKRHALAVRRFHKSYGISPVWFGFHVSDSSLIDVLVKELAEFTHNGRIVFREVHKSSEVYSTSHADMAPQIVFLTDPLFQTETHVYAREIIEINSPGLKGDHFSQREGVLFVPGISSPVATDLNLQDIVPSVLSYMGIEIPSQMTGSFSLFSAHLDQVEDILI